MTRETSRLHPGAFAALGVVAAMFCSGPSSTAADAPAPHLFDDVDDTVIRRTDPGNDGQISATANLADLFTVTLGGWDATNAAADPFTGT